MSTSTKPPSEMNATELIQLWNDEKRQKLENETQTSQIPVQDSPRQDVDSAWQRISLTLSEVGGHPTWIQSSGAGNDDVEYIRADIHAEITKERDRLIEVLETRAEREMEMLAGVAAENDALLSALKEVLNYGVEFDDERLDYIVAHVDRDAIAAARAAIALAESKEQK